MQNNLERLHFMDAMRSILMMLGVVLHSGQIFNPSQSWLIYSQESSTTIAGFVGMISTFRMPAFFVVSGYFFYLTLTKYKLDKFFKIRLKRIVIPFLFTALIINSLQAFVLHWSGWHPFDFKSYILDGEYVSHLWFLINLVVYFIFFGFVFSFLLFFKRSLECLFDVLFRGRLIYVLFLILPLFVIFLMSLNKLGLPLYNRVFGAFEVYSLLFYSQFFLFGVALSLRKDFLVKFCQLNPLGVFIIVLLAYLLRHHLEDLLSMNEIFHVIAKVYFSSVMTWGSVALCFFVFFNYFGKEYKITRMLSDSSYSVYLFHHVFVVIFGLLVIQLSINAWVGFILLVVGITLLTLAIHNFVIRRNKVLYYMFNGK